MGVRRVREGAAGQAGRCTRVKRVAALPASPWVAIQRRHAASSRAWITRITPHVAVGGGLAVAAALIGPVAAAAEGGRGQGGNDGSRQPPGPAPATLKLDLEGLDGDAVMVGDRVAIVGRLRPFVPGQKVRVRLARKGKVVRTKTLALRKLKDKNAGGFRLRTGSLTRPGGYRVRATKRATAQQAGARAKAPRFSLRYPDLDSGTSGDAVAIFNRLLRKRGYYTTDNNGYGSHTERAVMAFRKVNGMARTFNATPGIFKRIAAGKGGFDLRYPGAGRHVEVDISRQVMVLADNGKPQHTFHVSTGAAATPSDQGGYTFYSRQPGFNAVGMYYSVFYNRGEAIHGYHSVPAYPASHGCIRNPIPDSIFIYNWVNLGMKIWVYI
jgi:L,D-transpeptidase catalytic domain